MKLTALLSLFALASLSAKVRDWTSADGTRTFSGEVTSYDPATATVFVSVDGQEISFTTDKLSAEDRAFLATWTKETKSIAQFLELDKTHRLVENDFVVSPLAKTPQYFLLYYSASW